MVKDQDPIKKSISDTYFLFILILGIICILSFMSIISLHMPPYPIDRTLFWTSLAGMAGFILEFMKKGDTTNMKTNWLQSLPFSMLLIAFVDFLLLKELIPFYKDYQTDDVAPLILVSICGLVLITIIVIVGFARVRFLQAKQRIQSAN
jgi:peptidoglycan/LPS O-acetylase OafA/YrhL